MRISYWSSDVCSSDLQPDPIGRQRAIGTLLSGLTVKRDGLSYAISVSYEGNTPAQAAQIANALVDDYVAGQAGSKAQATRRAQGFLEERLQDLRAQVLGAERAVADYRAAHNLLDRKSTRLNSRH